MNLQQKNAANQLRKNFSEYIKGVQPTPGKQEHNAKTNRTGQFYRTFSKTDTTCGQLGHKPKQSRTADSLCDLRTFVQSRPHNHRAGPNARRARLRHVYEDYATRAQRDDRTYRSKSAKPRFLSILRLIAKPFLVLWLVFFFFGG